MTHLNKRKSAWALCTISHSTPIKRCWAYFDFLKFCLCRTTFCRLIALKEINHFPTKHRGLGNSYKVTIIFATLAQLKVEYRKQFCRNYKRAKACQLWIGEKRESIFLSFMRRIALLKRLVLFWIHIVTLKFKVVWFENTYNFVSIFKSRFVARYVSSFEETSMRSIFLSLNHHTIISPNSP